MKTVDEPESPSLLARRPDGRVLGAARRRSATSSRSTSQTSEVVNLTDDDFADYGADLLARRQVPDLQRARQRQPEAVPARPRHEEEDADHLRHARRDRGAVHRRQHDRVLVDGHRSGRAARAGRSRRNGNIYNIWTLDLTHRRAAAVHRRARRQLVAGRAERGQDQPHRVRQLLQGRVRHPHARAEGAAAHGGDAPTSARPGRSSTSRRRCSTRWSRTTRARRGTFEKMFLEGRPPVNVGVTSNGDVFGGIADHLRRRARRPAVQLSSPRRSRSTARCRSSYVNLSRRFQFALQGFSQTQFFYGAARRRLLRPGVRAVHRPRPAQSRRGPSAAAARSASTRSTATAAFELSGGVRPAAASSTTIPALQDYSRAVSAAAATADRSSATARCCRSASRSSRRRRSSASSGRSPATRCGSRYDVAPKIGSTAVAPDLRRRRCGTTCGSAPPACWRLRFRGFKSIGEFPDFTVLRRQLRAARLRLPAVRRTERRVRQRRAALPAHRGGAHADRRHRRHPRRVLREHRRRLVQQPAELQVRAPSDAEQFTTPIVDYAARSPVGRRRSSIRSRPACRSRSTGADRSFSGFRLQDGRASYGVGPRDLRARLPDPLRLVVADALQQGVGRRGLRRRRRQRRVPQAAVRGLDRLRLLDRLRAQGSRLGLSQSPEL